MKDNSYDFNTYLSPYTWRYGSELMRVVWSEINKRRLWRHIWVSLAKVQSEYGLVNKAQLDDLDRHANEIDMQRSMQIEKEVRHDLMAELKAFASQCNTGGGILHMGATSMDIEDNADAIRLKQSLNIVVQTLEIILKIFADKIEEWADLTVSGFTHLQAAAPTTLGYRFCLYAQDLLNDLSAAKSQLKDVKGKGFKGAVGSAATFTHLVGPENFVEFENKMSSILNLDFFPVTSQISSRKQEYAVVSVLAGIGASLHKFAFDLRILQSPMIGEVSESFGAAQIGSSAMPFKRNPIRAEKVDSLARNLAQLPRIAWDNAANSLLERTLDDSANRRSFIAESFLICDELLNVTLDILQGLEIDMRAIERNLTLFSSFSATEQVMASLSKKGADRQAVHNRLRELSLRAWDAIQSGAPNPLVQLIGDDQEFQKYISAHELVQIMNTPPDAGAAPFLARRFAGHIKEVLG